MFLQTLQLLTEILNTLSKIVVQRPDLSIELFCYFNTGKCVEKI